MLVYVTSVSDSKLFYYITTSVFTALMPLYNQLNTQKHQTCHGGISRQAKRKLMLQYIYRKIVIIEGFLIKIIYDLLPQILHNTT